MPNISDLPIESRYKQNIEDAARKIEYECADVLLPAPKGIYLINRVNPVMTDGIEYYTIEIKGETIVRTPVTDITNIKSPIYTVLSGIQDKLVISKTFMSNKEKFISSEPMLPFRGVKIIEGLVNNRIDNFTKYRKYSKDNIDIVSSHLIELDEETLRSTTTRISEVCDDIINELTAFMGLHDWNIYFVKLKDTLMTIEMSIDWRAYQYLLQLEASKTKEQENSDF